MKDDSLKISFITDITVTSVGNVYLDLSLFNSDDVVLSEKQASVFVFNNYVTTVVDFGSVDVDGYYYVVIEAFFSDNNIADDIITTRNIYKFCQVLTRIPILIG